ncbi:hypothetical protein BGZ49_000853, partial [Haplosporangium sp. Z 27]
GKEGVGEELDGHLPGSAREQLGHDLRNLVHHWTKHLYLVYRTRNHQLPTAETEGWFLNMLWGPLALILNVEEALQYKHAEYSSILSALRKNINRK